MRKIIGVTVGTPTSPEAMAAKIKPVTSVNGATPDENGNVELLGYATEQYVQDYAQPKGDYLTEHQDISGKLDADKLPEAIDIALAEAKESGEFDGKDGVDGKDGKDGVSGVYVGSGDMPDGYNVQIDPNGSETDIVDFVISRLPVYDGSVVSV